MRQVSEAQVAILLNSIADVGLLNPITVFKRQIVRGGATVDGYGLVAGLHRLTAYERLGLAEIERRRPLGLALIRGTKLDTGTYLDKLKTMPGSEQFRAATRDLAFERSKARTAKKAVQNAAAREAEALSKAWHRASPEVRTAFKKAVGLIEVVRPTKSLKPGEVGKPIAGSRH